MKKLSFLNKKIIDIGNNIKKVKNKRSNFINYKVYDIIK
jgi:hypothetical protein